MATFQIHLQLINQQSLPLPNLTVQAWIGNQKAGEALTDVQGNCTISITLPDPGYRTLSPLAYLMVYAGEKWIYGVKDDPQYVLEGAGLNLQVTIQTRRADLIPMTLKDFRRSAENLSELSAAQRNYVAGKLNAALSSAVQQALGEADTRFQETPVVLAQDYTALLHGTLGDVLKTVNTTRAFELDENVTTRLAQNPRSVREILHIEQPMIKSPIFYEAVQVLRTTELTDALLPGQKDVADKLLGRSLDWERASNEQWDALTGEGVVTVADRPQLQRGFALSRFTGGQTALVSGLMQEITDLRQMVTFDADHLLARIYTAGGETPNGETAEEYAANLVKLAQRNFPSAFLLQQQVWQPRHGEEEQRNHLREFLANNQNFDLRTANFFQKNAEAGSAYSYSGIPEEQQEGVRKKMMGYQRVMRLAESYEAQDALLAAGLDSSSDIMRRKPAEIQTLLGDKLSPAAIEEIMVTAQQQFEVVVNSTVAIHNVSSPQAIGFAVDNYPEDLINQLRDIDGYDKMFGSQDYCECDHCKSIFGPAAYFVDLMKFTEEKVQLMEVNGTTLSSLTPTEEDEHPISLRKRRPDLWSLELTCENTNAAVPYLMIINEIKQRYIAEVMGAILPKPAKDVDVWAEFARLPLTGNNTGFRRGLAANAGNTWKNSFRLPFNRPFEESQILLEHFGLTYREVLSALRVQAQYRMDQAYLGLSAEEWQLIVTPDTTDLNDLRNLRFGFPAERAAIIDVNIVIDAGFSLAECPVDVFLRATGLSRADAEFLLSDKSSLRTLTVNPAVKLERVQVQGEIQEYKEWIEGLSNPIVLDFIHRLLRLQRHLPWTLRELDLVVQTLGSFVIDEVVRIARIREMQRLFNLTVEEALALHQEIPNTSLYTRTVHDAFLNSTVEVAVPGMFSRMFDSAKQPPKVSGIPFATQFTDYKKWPEQLQRLSRCATEAAFGQMYLSLYGDEPLNLADISAAWRITRVANLLGLTLEELGYLTELCNLPFWNMNAGRVLTWKQALDDIKKMPLSLHEIWFIVRGEKTSKIDFTYRGDTLHATALELTATYVKDERVYINAEKILQELLPKTLQNAGVTPFSDALVSAGLLKKIAEEKFYVLKNAWLSSDDIPEFFPVKLGKAPVQLSERARSAIAERFNEENRRVQIEVFQEHLALLFKTGKESLVTMLNWLPDHPAVYDKAESNYYAAGPSAYATTELEGVFPQLERLCLLFDRLSLDDEDAAVWAIPPSDLPPFISRIATGAAPNGLNDVRIIEQVATYARFKKQAGEDEAGINAYGAMMQAAPSTWASAHTATFARALQCDVQEINSLAGALNAGQFNTDTLRQMEDLVRVFGRLGIYASNVLMAFKMNAYAEALVYETALRTAFRADFATEAAYEKAWEPYENRINELRRDVLCAFLLALDQQNNFRDTGDLYAYFLVDVEMSGCSRVSRILAATLSLQLYEHRVLMGLEATIPDPDTKIYFRAIMGEEAKRQWEWRKNYRVWEANRKVFLYPENWIEPELRHDKSPLFKTLEDELLQQKISLESAEQAYKQYLNSYLEISSLVIAGSYYHKESNYYYLFGRTKNDPYQYYYRKFYPNSKNWSAWEKIELAISSPYIGPIIYRNQLYLFWVDVVTLEKTKFANGNSEFQVYSHQINLNYSTLNANGKWLQPQKIKMGEEPINKYWGLNDFGSPVIQDDERRKEFNRDYYYSTKSFKKIYPSIINGKIHVQYLRESIQRDWDKNTYYLYKAWLHYSLSISSNTLKEEYLWQIVDNELLWTILPNGLNNGWLYFQPQPINAFPLNDADIDTIADSGARDWELTNKIQSLRSDQGKGILMTMKNLRHQFFTNSIDVFNYNSAFKSKELLVLDKKPALHIVHSSKIKGAKNGGDYIFEYDDQTYFIHRLPFSGETMTKTISRISTSITDDLIDKFTFGLEAFLSPETQMLSEKPYSVSFDDTKILCQTIENIDKLNFSGAHGLYYRELFFHIPFLIADHLNAEGKYKEADYWYRKIFDPSAAFNPNGTAKDRYWQFLEFRGQTLPKLKEILTDAATIEAYENNPFNPHAIAGVRSGPYQKATVMKYIDNLIDWGDSLFRRDTWESNTEAMLLYQLAHDILGKRPQKTGSCGSAIDTNNCGCVDPKTTYAKLKGASNQPFVYSVENWVANPVNDVVLGSAPVISGGGLIGYEDTLATVQTFGSTRQMNLANQTREVSYAVDFGGQLFSQNVFCIPGNEKIFDYWDRVEDRQYKLRHCMNIDGVKRTLALFQPPIDPALLVAAFAAGLSVDDVLNSLYGDLPAYRFSYLVEKAKAFAGTVQGFGNALLSALEKKDSEALTLLRSTQEQNILKMTKDVKKKAIEEAKANLQSTVEGMVNVMNRMMQYVAWIEEDLNGWERTQQVTLHASTVIKSSEVILSTISSMISLVPNVGAPTAITFGGRELSNSLSAVARSIKALGEVSALVSASAGLEASFQRRRQDWEFQKKTAEQEIKQVQQQIAAATIRLAIAEKDLEIHEKQIEQAEEVHDFYKNKFTGLGLYTYMAKTLNNLHRMAYNTALDMAKQAEAAYKFETGDDDYFEISGGAFWDASRVGLLSGESLTLELQKLEANFINWNQRQMEIRQSFSMRMIDPEQLLELREKGVCTFTIPEWAFDMQYPGHYRRRIVSVQITIPCVAGPYHNIATTLAMTKGGLKKGKDESTVGFTFRGSSMIATSNANNDGGQFDLNFRDERFLPFEGAGAVDSQWELELPKEYRSFDYDTISDVIFHVSYRAKYDGGLFKTNVEAGLPAAVGTLKRLISLKQEFPDVYFQLQTAQVAIPLDNSQLPMFAKVTSSFAVKAKLAGSSEWGSEITKNADGQYPISLAPGAGEDVYVLIEYKL